MTLRTSGSVFEQVTSETERTESKWLTTAPPDPLKQRAVVPCARAVLCSVRRSAEGMRAADS